MLHSIMHLVTTFMHNHGMTLVSILIMYRLGIFHLAYLICYNTISYLYLGYAYIVVGYRKLKKLNKRNNIISS
jgi:hypothetical protein